MAVDSSVERMASSSSVSATNEGTMGGGGSSQNDVLDLGSFMEHYHQVRDQVWPLGHLIVEVQKIRRWENYKVSLTVSISLSILLLYPRALISFITGLLFIFIIVSNQYILGSFLGNKEKRKSIPTPRLINNDAEVMERRSREERNRQKSLKEYRYIVKKADNTVVELGRVIDQIKSIYKWEDSKLSINVCFFLLVVSLSMLWISVSTLLSILSLLFFCLNHYFITRTKEVFLNIRKYFPQLRISQQVSNTGSNSRTVTGSLIDPISRRLAQTQQVQRPTSLGEDLTSSGEEFFLVSERTNRKDKGNCYKCGAAFTLLKRKHPCNNCGQVCCASCTVKVTRDKLGATSPAAFQQTVRVCQDCKDELDKREEQQTTTTTNTTVQNS